jgi:TonB family protein
MRWSERRTAVRSTFEDDFHTFIPSDARSRPLSLILFSLDLMRSDLTIRLVLLLCGFAVAQPGVAVEKPKSDAYKAYSAEAGTFANHAISAELVKHSERLKGISLQLKFRVDQLGRAHEVKIIPTQPNDWAQETARRILTNLKFAPFPKKLADEVGTNWVNIVAHVNIGPVRSRGTSKDSPDTVAYLMQVDNIVTADLDAEAVKRAGPISGSVTITLLIDPQGHVRHTEILSKPPNEWLQATAARAVRSAKLPPMPKEVVSEHGGDLIAFRTIWTLDKKD